MTDGVRIVAEAVEIEIAGRSIVHSADLEVGAGSVVAVVGPNGCGKTTLLRSVCRVQRVSSGRVFLGEHDVWAGSARESALLAAVVAQVESDDFEFTVQETVSLGRVPHHTVLRPRTSHDDRIVEQSLRTAGAEHLIHRLTSTLSGGERQRVAVARALAQETPVLILDEPTNHLDVGAQLELLDLLTSLPRTVLVVLHDLNLAATYADHVFVMDAGAVVTHGSPKEVLTPELIARVYGVSAHCSTNPLTGRPALHFASAAPAANQLEGPT